MTMIYLADLAYEMGSREMPLGILCIYSYLKCQVPDLEVKLFVKPTELKQEIERNAPDILMVSNYCWNTNLSLFFVNFAKQKCKPTVTIMGGPNISSSKEGRERFLRQNHQLDFYVLHDSEIAVSDLVKALLSNALDIEKTKSSPHAGVLNIYDGQFVETPCDTLLKSLDDIPDFYSDAIVDVFFQSKMIPRMQTVRGCPYSCSYCNLGNPYYNRLKHLSPDRFKNDLSMVAQKMKKYRNPNKNLHLIDDNFGLFPEDGKKAQVIREVFEETGFPEHVELYTPKIITKEILDNLEPIKDLIYVSNTMQSFNMDTLKAIKRPSMTITQFLEKASMIRSRGFKMQSELIYSLPLETRESFSNALEILEGNDFSDYIIYQLSIIEGSEIDQPAYWEKFGFRFKYRTQPAAQLMLDGQPIKDHERIVVETSALNLDDYYYFRLLTFLMRVRVRICDQYEDLKALFKASGISAVKISDEIITRLRSGTYQPNVIWDLLRDFDEEAHRELSDQPQDQIAEQQKNLVHVFRDRLLSHHVELNQFFRDIIAGWQE